MNQALPTRGGSKSNAPPRIYGWLDTQLSVARFYGGITYCGASYVIDTRDPEHPLVRADVLKAEQQAKRAAEKKKALRGSHKNQIDLLNEVKP